LSKLIGIKVVSEVARHLRGWYILGLVSFAGLTLVGFALVPPPYNMFFFFLNGLPLGMIYGLVLGFLEGRRQTDILMAALTASFIFASGFVKTIGLYVMQNWGVSEFYMPMVTAGLFIPAIAVFLTMLMRLPAPNAEDVALRTERVTMKGPERRKFVQTFFGGIVFFIVGYVLLTILRDFRDNFGREIFQEQGVNNPAVFSAVETPIALGILVMLGFLARVQDNFRAFTIVNWLTFSGVVLAIFATVLFQANLIRVEYWMLFVGAGMYLGYVPANGIYFERIIGAFRYPGTVGFIVTLADTWGYMGSFGLQLYKNFGQADISYTTFLIYAVYVLLGSYGILVLFAYRYFQKRFIQLAKV
jgi:MFS family permease